MLRVALATSEQWPVLAPDDASLVSELDARGFKTEPAVWSDRSIDWKSFDRVIIRSCWDYHLRLAEFLTWVDAVPAIRNPADVIRWNAHKSYLLELGEKGVRIPETILIPRGAGGDTRAPMIHGPLIVKPAVSASAYETHLFASFAEARDEIDRLVRDHDVVVQEFVSEVIDSGEWSLIYFGGTFSHAVKKAPKAGDFRVQQELGGSVLAAVPSRPLLQIAQKALYAVGRELVYARVDLVDTAPGPLLMEIELIEPGLFLATDPGAPRRFAAAIAS